MNDGATSPEPNQQVIPAFRSLINAWADEQSSDQDAQDAEQREAEQFNAEAAAAWQAERRARGKPIFW